MIFRSSEIRILNKDEYYRADELLLQASMSGNSVELSCERNPDVFFLPNLKAQSSLALGFFIKETLVGFALLIIEKRYINGTPQKIWSLSRVFINEKGRSKGFLLRLSEFEPARRFVSDRSGYALTLVGNTAVEKYLERSFSKFPRMPQSQAKRYNVSSIRPTWALPRVYKEIEIQRAVASDATAILELLQSEQKKRFLGKYWDLKQLNRETLERASSSWSNWWIAKDNKGVCGLLYAWDISQCNVNRVQGVHWTMKLLIKVWNRFFPLFGALKLPTEGQDISIFSIHDICIVRNRNTVLPSLISAVGKEARRLGVPLMMMASDRNDPNLTLFKSLLGYELKSRLILFGEAINENSTGILHYCDSDLF